MAEQRVLVTGASGFIGANMMQTLIAAGVPARGIDVVAPRNPGVREHVTTCDILDLPALRRLVNDFQPTVVHHLAARTDLDGATAGDYPANIEGVSNVLDAALGLAEPPRLLMASTRLVFEVGHNPKHDYDYLPSTAYGESKILGEEIVRQSGYPDWLITRPTSIWGPWFDIPYRNFFDAVCRRYYVHPRGAVTRKALGYVGNAVHEMVTLAAGAPAQRPYWISDYEPYVVHDWAEEVRDAFGVGRIRTAPMPLLRTAARAGDIAAKVGVRAPITSFRLHNLTTDVVYDIGGTQNEVGPLPYTRREGVAQTVAWLGSQT